MATTKVAEKKPVTKKTDDVPAQDPLEKLSDQVLQVHLHRTIVTMGEPARLSEIVREIGDDAITVGLARHIVDKFPRKFVAVDRRWDVTQRFLDAQRPVARTLEELLTIYGAPVPADEIAVELSHVYHRVREYFDDIAIRLLRGNRFFAVDGGRTFGLRSWLLDTSAVKDEDVLFYNFIQPETLVPFAKMAKGLEWTEDLVAASHDLLSASGMNPLDNRVVQYFAWKAIGEQYDPVAHYAAMHERKDLFVALGEHNWILKDELEPVRQLWRSLADSVADLSAEEPAAAVEADAPIKELEITPTDLDELRRYFSGREDIVTAGTLVSDVFEVRPGDRSFHSDVATLIGYLKTQKDDFLWVGNDRFRLPSSIPPYIGQIPESLTFPTLPKFVTSDGEILDQMLSDQAFEEGLDEHILDPLAQDVNDQEPATRTRWSEGVSASSPWLRLVLKSHHKEIGTFPLAQVPFGFFPTEPNIVELTLRDNAGNGYPIYVDYDVQLIYGLFDVFADIAAESGAVFHLERTDKPDEYKFVYNNETDTGVFISPARFEELTERRAEVEAGSPISTYDIVRQILDHYRKGATFLTLLTEVNAVRRTPRRLLTSILSGYAAFHQRANRWTFDPKKEPDGFDKRKAAFIIK